MNSKKLKLSLIIPCYNESDSLELLINKLFKIEDNFYEIILVNNGSTDDTKSIVNKLIRKKLKFRLINLNENIGYGHGIMSGVKESSGDIIAWTHADLQTDPIDVVDAFNKYIKFPDYKNSIIKGKRVGRNFFDFFFTFCMGVISSFLLKVNISDVNAQPKMFHIDFLKLLTQYPKDFSLDLFVLYKAKVNGYEIYEHPVDFKNRLYGEAKGGGTIIGKIKLIIRTLSYIIDLKSKLNNNGNYSS